MTRNITLHFTSIASLRTSHADQSRVTRVANNLKKLNPAWQDAWFFPATAVGLSNSFDDVSWVISADSVHLENMKQNLVIDGATFTFEALRLALDKAGIYFGGVHSRADAEAKLAQIDAVLSELAGKPVSWTAGLHDNVMAVVAGMSKDADPLGAVIATQNEIAALNTPVNQLINVMHNMEVADIMAAITAVNSARGGLLKGAQPEELSVFVQSMTGNQGLRVEWPVGTAA